MTNNQIVEELISTGFVKNYVRKRAIGWPQEDIEQDIYLILLDYPLLDEIYSIGGINKVRALTAGIIQRHLSEKGKGYRLYKREIKYTDEEIPEIGYEQKQNIY
jgi:hypothetical protein